MTRRYLSAIVVGCVALSIMAAIFLSEEPPVISTDSEPSGGAISAAEEREFVDRAYAKATKGMQIDSKDDYEIRLVGNDVVITWPYHHVAVEGRPPTPGPDYVARVKIDRLSGEIKEILGAQ